MQPATDPTINYKDLVQQGFDRCAAAYECARRGTTNPELALLMARLPTSAQVLDIGCGAGVDLSAEQIRRAQHNVPTGHP